MKRRLVEKVTVDPRRCWSCDRLWPAGTKYMGRIGVDLFKCPGGCAIVVHYNGKATA